MPISFGQAAAIGLHLVECGKLVYCDPNEMNQRLARVYDLRNAGPHHRFTVSGRLVHNCGYGGGVGALKAMGAKMPEEEMQPLVDAWRAANPHIVQSVSYTHLDVYKRQSLTCRKATTST